MLCCIRRTKPVEKNEEADQKIEQDGTINKPEDKAHKAATKIQASFRGHITRKKMKDGEEEKEGDSPVATEEATEGGDETKKVEGEEALAKDEVVAKEEAKNEKETSQAKSPVADKPANSPAGTATSPGAAISPTDATVPPEPQKEAPNVEEKGEEKPTEVDAPVLTANSSTTARAEEKEAESEEIKEEARQSDVPAAASLTTEEESNQTKDKQDAAEMSKAEEVGPSATLAGPTESKND